MAEGARQDGTRRDGPPVIGLAGGIGSGKSALARAFASLGCVVIDFDAESRAALDLPAVREQLESWWGPGILDGAGRVDRSKVGSIVFDRPEERLRLERLIHPLVWRTREQASDLARAAGAPAAVMDAPLLFEAGLDRECDAVVFVDAPWASRVARVRARNGWSEAELRRRESAQRPPEQKRERCRFVVENRGPESAMLEQAGRILATLARGPLG